MENYNIREVLEQAVQTEKLGYQYYTEMAARFKEDQKLTKLFGVLAQKELRHEKTYADLRDMVGDEVPEKWEEISPYLRAIVESQFFLGKDKSIPSMDRIKNVSEAVDYALGFEKETLLYFYGVRDVVREKELVDEIINEEKSHIMWLNVFKDTLVKR